MSRPRGPFGPYNKRCRAEKGGCGRLVDKTFVVEGVRHQYCSTCLPKVEREVREGKRCKHGRRLAECCIRDCTARIIMES